MGVIGSIAPRVPGLIRVHAACAGDVMIDGSHRLTSRQDPAAVDLSAAQVKGVEGDLRSVHVAGGEGPPIGYSKLTDRRIAPSHTFVDACKRCRGVPQRVQHPRERSSRSLGSPHSRTDEELADPLGCGRCSGPDRCLASHFRRSGGGDPTAPHSSRSPRRHSASRSRPLAGGRSLTRRVAPCRCSRTRGFARDRCERSARRPTPSGTRSPPMGTTC